MNPNERLLAQALCTAIKEVNFLADFVCTDESEGASIDLLDRLEDGLAKGKIELQVDPSMFTEDGCLNWA